MWQLASARILWKLMTPLLVQWTTAKIHLWSKSVSGNSLPQQEYIGTLGLPRCTHRTEEARQHLNGKPWTNSPTISSCKRQQRVQTLGAHCEVLWYEIVQCVINIHHAMHLMKVQRGFGLEASNGTNTSKPNSKFKKIAHNPTFLQLIRLQCM